MGQKHLKSTNEGPDKIDINQAAQTLRNTLALATLEAKIPVSSISVQSLQDPLPLSPVQSTNEASPFPSPGLSSSEFNVGLGLKMDDSTSVAVDAAVKESLHSSPKEPSLYAHIFGLAYSRMTSQTPSTPSATMTNRPQQSKSLSPHVRQGSSAQLEKIALSPRLSQSPNWRQGRPLDTRPFAPPILSPVKRSEVILPMTPRRERMRSAGGSLLPNGHPASSLAQDLGIASGSTPRSRNQSRDRTSMSHHGSSRESTKTPPPRNSISSSFRTPQKRGRRSSQQADMTEAAAQSLLVLAESPSPYHDRHVERFAGATPSLGSLVEEISPGSKTVDLYDTNASVPTMGSPPMTPPRSNRGRKITFGGEEAADSGDSSPCPDTTATSSRKGSIVLLSDLPREESNKKSSRHLSEPLQATTIHHDQTSTISETPRTPPPLTAPSTPKAPGSHFNYGDWLHASPSPQPRMRINSMNGTPRITSILDTPSKGTKSRARFHSYSTMIDADEGPSNLTELEMSDVLTPGRLTSGKHILEASPLIGNDRSSAKKPKILF